jgi:hypothetical protein
VQMFGRRYVSAVCNANMRGICKKQQLLFIAAGSVGCLQQDQPRYWLRGG